MGFWSKLFGREEKQVIDATGARSLAGLVTQANAPRRGTKELLEAYRSSPWLQAVTRKIAEHIAAVPWTLHVVRQDGQAVRAAQIQGAAKEYRGKMLARFKETESLSEIVDHPLLDLLNTANPMMTGLQGRYVTSLHLDLKGECFWLLVLNQMNQPMEFWPLPSHWVNGTPSSSRPYYDVSMNGKRMQVPVENMIWQRYINPADPYSRGVGPGEALADEIDTDEALAETVKSGFYNRALPELFVSIKGVESQSQLQHIAQRFKNQYRGPLRAKGVHFHTGDVSVERLSQTFEEMQALEMRSWERDAFRGMYGVPPEIMGLMGSSNRATAFEARRIFTNEVLMPRLEHQRAEYQDKLVPYWDDRLIIDYESPAPDDREFALDAAKAAPWALTRGEWRVLTGHEDRGDVDQVHLVSLGNIEVRPSLETPEALEAPVEAPAEEEPAVPTPEPELSTEGRTKAYLTKAGEGIANATVSALRPELLSNELLPEWERNIELWGTGVIEGVGVSGQAFNMLNPLVVEHLREVAGDRIKDLTNETTKKVLRAQIIEGVQAGEGYREISKRVEDVFSDARGYRARNIARTEVTRSANFATNQAHIQSGVVSQKQWVATPDERTRAEHSALDGQVVDVGEAFEIGGMSAQYPGEFGIPEMDIACRCTTIAVIPNPPEDLGEIDPNLATFEPKELSELVTAWKEGFEAPAMKWEERGIAALRRGFVKQEKAALKALKDILGS